MTEERVTISIMEWLQKNGWEFICHDFPQSGTGVCLQPNNSVPGSKNQNVIIPDIVAFRKGIVVFFENKSDYWEQDFNKLYQMKSTASHSESLNEILEGYDVNVIYYGVGLHETPNNIAKGLGKRGLVDFFVSVNENMDVNVNYDPFNIFP